MTRADIAQMIGQAEAAGAGHLVGLLRPVMRRELNVMVPMRATTALPFYRLSKRGLPVACANRVREWARFAIVHGTGAKLQDYEMAADLAKRTGRLLFIETTSAAAQDWAGFLRGRTPALPFMGLLPPDGVHPVPLAKGNVH